jgi:hypothetical protein
MNVVAFFEMNPDDFDKAIEKFQEVSAARENETGKYPKAIFGPVSMGGQWKGFVVYENPTDEQLNAVVLQYRGIMSLKFIPIFDSVEVIKQYMESK